MTLTLFPIKKSKKVRECISYYKGTIRYNDICPKKICFLIVALGQPEKKINLFYRIILGHWLTGM